MLKQNLLLTLAEVHTDSRDAFDALTHHILLYDTERTHLYLRPLNRFEYLNRLDDLRQVQVPRSLRWTLGGWFLYVVL